MDTRIPRTGWRPIALLCASGCAAGVIAAAFVLPALPFPRAELGRYPASLRLLSSDGRPLRVTLGDGDVVCTPVSLAETSDWAVRALVAAEDKRFYSHHGVDLAAIARAAWLDLRLGRPASGASTISMQVIRMMEPRRRTLRAKLIEAFRAGQLERILGKDAILEQYLNRAPFGANLRGIEAASRCYFAKAARDLTLGESALLIGLLQSPSRFRPDRHCEAARARREYVFDRMEACGFITPAQRAAATRQSLAVARQPLPFAAPHFCDLVLSRRGRGRTGAQVTTLDAGVQRRAEQLVRRHAARMAAHGVHGCAAVIIDVRTCGVIALIGSPDYRDEAHAGQVNAAAARRSPGSALKTFAYALGFDRGMLTPGTMIADVPVRMGDYQPRNYAKEFSGLVTARAALVDSLNIPALHIVREAGTRSFTTLLGSLGLASAAAPRYADDATVVLGAAAVSPLDLANAYACLARGGVYAPYRLLGGQPAAPGRRIFSEEAAWLVTDILGGDERALALAGHAADARMPRIAWKTGTSAGARDAWTVAWNPEYVAAVWLGNPDGTPAPALVGIEAAAPLAFDLMRALYPHGLAPWFRQPAGIARRDTCTLSGRPASSACTRCIHAAYIAGVSDPAPCTMHGIAGMQGERDGVAQRWPAAVATYLAGIGVPASAGGDALSIVSPPDSSTYILASASAAQSIRLASAGGARGARQYWFVDDALLSAGPADQEVSWRLQQGAHSIVCADERGNTAVATITVE